MKKIILILLLLPLLSTAQRKSYFEVSPGISRINSDQIHPSFGVGFGARPKNFCIGIGASLTSYGSSSYVPVYIQAALTPQGKFAPYASFRFGQGFYKYRVNTLQTKGVAYMNGNVGFSFANKSNAKFTIAGGFTRSQFENNYVGTKGRYWVDGYTIFLSFII